MKHLTEDGAEAEAMDETGRHNTDNEAELHNEVKVPYDLNEEIDIEEIFSDDQENNVMELGNMGLPIRSILQHDEKQGVQPGAESTKKIVQHPQSREDFLQEHT